MTEDIRIYQKHELEYQRLNTFAELVNHKLETVYAKKCEETGRQYKLSIQNTYFDMGQHWAYSAVITDDLSETEASIMRSWQTLCPRDYEFLIACDSFTTIDMMAEKYIDHLFTSNNEILCKNL